VLLYYITDRRQFSGDTDRLLAKISEATAAGVDYIQLREKALPARDLEELASLTKNQELRTKFPTTRVLVNSRADIALAAGLGGVHLPSNEISPREVRGFWRNAVIGVSCHSAEEVATAARDGADFAVFGPVFEKENTPPQGLARLREACQASIPVLALGGVTIANAKSCVDVGAAGIAAIRLFQENNVTEVVRELRGLEGQ
jgi:thiamine-phosphate pyrophosphorylase